MLTSLHMFDLDSQDRLKGDCNVVHALITYKKAWVVRFYGRHYGFLVHCTSVLYSGTGPSGLEFFVRSAFSIRKASGFIRKASGFYSKSLWVLFEKLLGSIREASGF